ncbi:MAG: WG repeat-containing protein [Prevotella sp.]|nr:WG repeat-containing protein [Prevotella sp.]
MKALFLKSIATLLFLSIFLFPAGCTKPDNRLFSIEKNDLYGYADARGDTVVGCQYTLCFTDTITRIGFVADQHGRISCLDNQGKFLFFVFAYDNGPDNPSEGLFRIIGQDGRMGYADTLGHIVIEPRYKFAHPFVNGRAKVADRGSVVIEGSPNGDRHETWVSEKWYHISR